MIFVDEKVLDFLTGIHERRCPEGRRGAMLREAFRKAYGDMATHTLTYASEEIKTVYMEGSNKQGRCDKNKRAVRRAVREYIRTDFDELIARAPEPDFDYDAWHKATCERIVHIGEGCPAIVLVRETGEKDALPIQEILCHQILKLDTVFTYGQAQKLVNMMAKYLYIYDQCEGLCTLEPLRKRLHTPIDSLVLKHSVGGGKSDRYRVPSTNQLTPWSQINHYSDYLSCQAAITAAIHEPTSPYYADYRERTGFEWELGEWPFKTPSDSDEG